MVLKRAVLAFFLALYLFCPTRIFAYESPGSPDGFVNDFAELLTLEQKQSLETRIIEFERQSANEIAVVTIQSLNSDTIENFAEELFREWGIGKKDQDNGVLILVAEEDREMRIEVGYGLEGTLTDAQASGIIRNILTPAFQEENYYAGLDQAVGTIIKITQGEPVPEIEEKTPWFVYIFGSFWAMFAGLLIFMWMASILSRSKSWWGGGVVGLMATGLVWKFTPFSSLALPATSPTSTTSSTPP